MADFTGACNLMGNSQYIKLLFPSWNSPPMEYIVTLSHKQTDTKTDITYNAQSD